MQSKQPHSRRCERGVPAEDAALRLRGPCALASNRLRLRSVPRLAGIDGYEEDAPFGAEVLEASAMDARGALLHELRAPLSECGLSQRTTSLMTTHHRH